MPIYLANDSRALAFHELLLPDRRVMLKGSRVLNAIAESCEFLVEEIREELFIIRYNVFRFTRATSVTSRSGVAGIHARFMLKNGITHSIKGIGKLPIREDQFAVLSGAADDCKVTFQPSGEYIALDIFYTPTLAREIASVFPELQKLIDEDGMKLIGKQPCFINPAVRDVLRQLIECPFDARTREFYFEIKVRELLYVMMEQIYHPKKSGQSFTAYETEKLIEARDYLLKDLTRTPPTIRELSRIVAINEFKLKAGFKHFFGVGVFECLQQARMEKARELLLNTNKPIKEICTLTGYPRMTNFITAFRKRFGYPPGSLRRIV